MHSHTSTLPNGLRVLLLPQAQAPTVTALVLVATGSMTETAPESGISHILEHMCFKGTPTFPNAKDIATHFDRLGAVSNAFTSHEYTGYFAKGNPEHLADFVCALADIFANSSIDPAELEKEKGVIIEEFNMYEDMPQAKVAEVLMECMFGNTPAGRSIIGTKETIRGISAEALRAYRDRQYRADDTLVVISGGFDAAAAQHILAESFGALPTGHGTPLPATNSSQRAFAYKLHHKKTDQAHIAIGFHGLPQFHTDSATLALIAIVLGGGMSSRLFLKLREELGAAYYVRTNLDTFRDFGVISVVAGIDKNRFDQILGAIVDELMRIKTELVPDTELAKAKAQAEGALRRGLESSDDIALYAGHQYLFRNTFKTIDERIAEIARVTPDDLLRLAQEHFKGTQANLAVVGDIDEDTLSGAASTRLATL